MGVSDLFEDLATQLSTKKAELVAAERAFALLPKPPIGIPDTIETRAAWAVQEIEGYQRLADAAMTAKGRVVVNVSLGHCHVVLRSKKTTETAIADLVLAGIEIMNKTTEIGADMQHTEEIAKKDAEISSLRARVKVLESALRPFEELGRMYDIDQLRGEVPIYMDLEPFNSKHKSVITTRDFVDARRALVDQSPEAESAPTDDVLRTKVAALAALRREAQAEDVKNFTDLSEYTESEAFARDARISQMIEEICNLVSPAKEPTE